MKNQRVTIMMTQEYRTAIEERAKIAGVNMSTYAHRCLDSYNASPDQSPTESGANPTSSGEYLTDLGNASTDILFSELEIKNQQIEKLQQALDQEQQLHAVSQKTMESQRLQLDEYRRPKTLMARLKAVLVVNP